MKIILESELEKWAWEVMMAVHCKWAKNHGSVINDQLSWYFDELYKDEKENMVKQEVERRLKESWPDGYGVSEEDYVAGELAELVNFG